MKITNKLAAIASAAVLALSFTGCGDLTSNFGKDDFFGTWVADYSQGNDKGVAMTMFFDGKSENLFNGGDGLFCQSKVAYTALNEADAETGAVTGKTARLMNFYWGSYTLKDNSNYTAGTISLTYMAGINFNKDTKLATIGEGTYDLNDLVLITFGKSGKDAEGNATGLAKANATDNPTKAYKTGKDFFDAHIDAMTGINYYTADGLVAEGMEQSKAEKQAELRGDIETFNFSLSDGDLLAGYCALNMHEWYWEDQIRFTNSQEDGKGTWSVANGSGYDPIANGISTGTSSGRNVSWFQPNLKKTQRGTAKNKYTSEGSTIMYKEQAVSYTAGTTPTWSKKYFSTGMCSWDVSERAFSRIHKGIDVAAAQEFLAGERTDMKKNYINYVMNTMEKDAYEPDDSQKYDDDDDFYSAFVVDANAEYASDALIDLVGAPAEK